MRVSWSYHPHYTVFPTPELKLAVLKDLLVFTLQVYDYSSTISAPDFFLILGLSCTRLASCSCLPVPLPSVRSRILATQPFSPVPGNPRRNVPRRKQERKITMLQKSKQNASQHWESPVRFRLRTPRTWFWVCFSHPGVWGERDGAYCSQQVKEAAKMFPRNKWQQMIPGEWEPWLWPGGFISWVCMLRRDLGPSGGQQGKGGTPGSLLFSFLFFRIIGKTDSHLKKNPHTPSEVSSFIWIITE